MRVLSLRALVRLAFTLAMLVLALVGSALLHLRTPLGRQVGLDLLNVYVTQLIAGRLHAQRIEEIGLERIVVRDVSLYDPNGTRVIYGETIVLVIDPWAALDGALRFSHARLLNGRLRLEEDPATGQPTFLSALAARDQSPSTGEPFHAIVDDMHLEEVRVYGELLGLEGIYADHVRAHGRMEFHHETVIRVFSGSGTVRAPFEYVGYLDNIVATVNTNDRIGTDLYVRAHTGQDRVRVDMHYGLPAHLYDGAATPLELDLRVNAEPVHGETLAASGFEWASILTGEIRGLLRLHGPTDRLRLEGRMRTEGGFVELSGELPSEGDVVVRAESHALDIAGLIDGAPEAIIDGSIALRVPEEGEATFEASVKPFRYATYAVPELTATGRLLDDSVALDAIRGSDAGGVIEGSGVVGFDQSYRLQLTGALQETHTEPNVALLAPELRGGLDFRAEIAGSPERMDVQGTFAFRQFRYEPATAATLTATGRIGIDDGLPSLDLRVSGRDVRVSGVALGSGSTRIVGDAGRYRFTGTMQDASGRESRFESQLRIEGETISAEVPTLVLSRGGVTWSGSATGVRVGETSIDLDDLRLANGQQTLQASAHLRDGAPDEVDVRLEAVSIPELRRFVGEAVPASDGTLDLALEVRGEADVAPAITLEGELRDITILGVAHSSAAYRVVLTQGEADIEAGLTLAQEGSVRVSGSGLVEGSLYDMEQAIRDGVYNLAIDVDRVSLAVVDRATGGNLPENTTGRLTGQLDVDGPIAAPTFMGALSVPDLRMPGWPDLSLRLATRYEYGSLSGNASLADAQGTLVEGEGSVMIDLAFAMENPDEAVSALDTSPWRFSIRVPPRPMAGVPVPVLEALPFDPSDFQVAGSITLAGGAFRTRGHLLASVDYLPDPSDGGALCGAASEPRATLVAELGEGRTHATLHGVVAGRRVLTMTATAATPLDRWLREADVPEIPPIRVEAAIDQAPTDQIPIFCEYVAGNLTGAVVVDDLFGTSPNVDGELSSDRLRWRRLERSILSSDASAVVETQPIKIRVGFGANTEEITLDGDMQWWNGGQTSVDGRIASTWAPGAVMPTIADDAAIDTAIDLFRMPLEAAVAWVPGLDNIDGLVQGRASLTGTLAEPHIAGSLDVEDGQFDLRTLGQRLRDVHGHVELTDEGLRLESFEASDSEGTAMAGGFLELDGLALARSRLSVRARSFPIRNEGTVMARLTGNAEITNEFVETGIEGRMRIASLEVTLPETSSRSPQVLASHPDVCIRELVPGTNESRCPDPAEEVAEDEYAVRLAVDATRPFWVKSEDFEALVTADLDVTYSDDLYVGGRVNFRRGFFEVFGRRFDVEEGYLQFDSRSAELNPEVDLKATHHLRGSQDRTVTVRATGTLANPLIEFTSTVPTNNEGEIIALLITGTTSQRRETAGTSALAAADEAADFLAGVAFGVASLSLREEFGRNFPSINVETADGGFRSARLRAGWSADDILPERMRNVVQGVYIEGYFTMRGQQDTSDGASGSGATSTGTGQDAGFLIELQFPHNIVGTGTYSPPSNWGVDVTWEP